MYSFPKSRAALAATLFLATAMTGASASPTRAQASFLISLDVDGDGKVTVDEATLARNLRFETSDTNGDGHLDAAEYDAMLQGTRNRYANLGQSYRVDNASRGRIDAFTFSDSNADGFITRDEFARGSSRFARSLDKNGDGVITPIELTR